MTCRTTGDPWCLQTKPSHIRLTVLAVVYNFIKTGEDACGRCELVKSSFLDIIIKLMVRIKAVYEKADGYKKNVWI